VEPGVFGTSLRVPKEGVYDVAFLLDKPRVSHCFTMTVQEDPSAAKSAKKLGIEIEETPAVFAAGEKATLRFRVIEKATGAASVTARPVTVLWMQPGGLQGRIDALPEGNGRYTASFTVPQKGVYYLTFQSPLLGIRVVDTPPVVLSTGDVKAADPKPIRKPKVTR
jgi:hypothetical protein